jgi:hypothetical protein
MKKTFYVCFVVFCLALQVLNAETWKSSVDPIDDTILFWVAPTVKTGFTSFEKPYFVFRIGKKSFEGYWTIDRSIGTSTHYDVSMRVAKMDATTSSWSVSSSNESLFIQDDSAILFLMFTMANQVALRVTDDRSETLTAVFDISGLAEKSLDLLEEYPWFAEALQSAKARAEGE